MDLRAGAKPGRHATLPAMPDPPKAKKKTAFDCYSDGSAVRLSDTLSETSVSTRVPDSPPIHTPASLDRCKFRIT